VVAVFLVGPIGKENLSTIRTASHTQGSLHVFVDVVESDPKGSILQAGVPIA
jgi:hypothetical protein